MSDEPAYDWSTCSATTFKRRHEGLTKFQFEILCSMEGGEIRRGAVTMDGGTMYRLVDRGLVEYVQKGTGNHYDDVWKVTDAGRAMMRRLLTIYGQKT